MDESVFVRHIVSRLQGQGRLATVPSVLLSGEAILTGGLSLTIPRISVLPTNVFVLLSACDPYFQPTSPEKSESTPSLGSHMQELRSWTNCSMHRITSFQTKSTHTLKAVPATTTPAPIDHIRLCSGVRRRTHANIATFQQLYYPPEQRIPSRDTGFPLTTVPML